MPPLERVRRLHRVRHKESKSVAQERGRAVAYIENEIDPSAPTIDRPIHTQMELSWTCAQP